MTTELKEEEFMTDRTQTLRDMLRYPFSKDDLVPAVREISRLLIAFDMDIANLLELKKEVTNLQKLIVEFMATQQTRPIGSMPAACASTELPKENEKFMSWDYMKKRVLPSVIAWAVILLVGGLAAALWLAFRNALGLNK